MANEQDIRNDLFDAEPISPERQEQFRAELAQIVEPPLSRSHRRYYLMGLVGMLAGLPGAALAFYFDAENRWLWALVLVANTASAGWFGYILRRKAEPFGIMQGMSKVLSGVTGVAAMCLIIYGIQNPSLASILWAMLGLVVFLFLGLINLWNRLLATERTIREQVLRVEYRLVNQERPSD